jgi:hypothetical protein
MARESFQNPGMARHLNRVFVCIKVDREERPDIDAAYMRTCHFMAGRGGWPLTILMTPDKEPFYAATYLPTRTRFGMKGLFDLTLEVEQLWHTRREQVVQTAHNVLAAMTAAGGTSQETTSLSDRKPAEEAYGVLCKNYDAAYGGFGNAPKFPMASTLRFLLRYGLRTDRHEALAMVERTLHALRCGGIYDHLGFGFHRYATDRRWRIPHFEKMLDDQATLSLLYTDVYRALKKPFFRTVAEEIFTYVQRDLTRSDGLFYSAHDADSDGEEGAFYRWTFEEVADALDARHLAAACAVFSLSEAGNLTGYTSGEYAGTNVLSTEGSYADIASSLSMMESELDASVETIRTVLFKRRQRRPRPARDEKVLTDLNALMIVSLARAGYVFENDAYVLRARTAAEALLDSMVTNGTLLHRLWQGDAGIDGLLADYAYLSWALLELYTATFEVRYLSRAAALAERMLSRFWDDDGGGFFLSAEGEILPMRQKSAPGGATPMENAAAAHVLIILGHMTNRIEYLARAEQVLAAFEQSLLRAPYDYPDLLLVHDALHYPIPAVVVVGKRWAPDTQAMLAAARTCLPYDTLVVHRPVEDGEVFEEFAPHIRQMEQKDGRATAYVCRDFSCAEPTTDIKRMTTLVSLQR